MSISQNCFLQLIDYTIMMKSCENNYQILQSWKHVSCIFLQWIFSIMYNLYLWMLGWCWKGSGSTAAWFHRGCTSAPVQTEGHQTPVEHNKQDQICEPVFIYLCNSRTAFVKKQTKHSRHLAVCHLLCTRWTFVVSRRRKVLTVGKKKQKAFFIQTL